MDSLKNDVQIVKEQSLYSISCSKHMGVYKLSKNSQKIAPQNEYYVPFMNRDAEWT